MISSHRATRMTPSRSTPHLAGRARAGAAHAITPCAASRRSHAEPSAFCLCRQPASRRFPGWSWRPSPLARRQAWPRRLARPSRPWAFGAHGQRHHAGAGHPVDAAGRGHFAAAMSGWWIAWGRTEAAASTTLTCALALGCLTGDALLAAGAAASIAAFWLAPASAAAATGMGALFARLAAAALCGRRTGA